MSQMNAKQLLAGILATLLYKLQMWTRGHCGGFVLYQRLWQAYTNDYRISRTGYVLHDLRI